LGADIGCGEEHDDAERRGVEDFDGPAPRTIAVMDSGLMLIGWSMFRKNLPSKQSSHY